VFRTRPQGSSRYDITTLVKSHPTQNKKEIISYFKIKCLENVC